MASIQVDTGSGKKSVDSEIPLIPFIDLLLCCVMFLLATAVWQQLAAFHVNQQGPCPSDEIAPPPGERLILTVERDKLVLASTLGDRQEIPNVGTDHDLLALRDRLRERRSLLPNERQLTIAPDDAVRFEEVVATMDTATGAGFWDVSLSGDRGL
ncbi:MAG: biopolymer transporter ExbD [Myxococcota bacterium]